MTFPGKSYIYKLRIQVEEISLFPKSPLPLLLLRWSLTLSPDMIYPIKKVTTVARMRQEHAYNTQGVRGALLDSSSNRAFMSVQTCHMVLKEGPFSRHLREI